MAIEVKEIKDCNIKSHICDRILRALPGWFGIEESIVNYTSTAKHMPLFAAFDGEKPVGFAAVKDHNAYTAEVCVMGVLPGYHRQGIGKRLIYMCEDYCLKCGKEFLTVKTLDESREDEGYAKTRAFYAAAGFRPLEVFPLHWDKSNPCLFMAKYIGRRA